MKPTFHKVYREPALAQKPFVMPGRFPRSLLRIWDLQLERRLKEFDEFFRRDPYCLDPLAREIRKDRL